MSSICIVVLLSLTSAFYIRCIDAGVVILNTSGKSQAVTECGQSLTLTCKFKKNPSVIVWKLSKVISPIAICNPNYCTINPAYGGQYKISYDKTRCITNLTLIQVTMEYNGRILVCSDGSHTDSKIIAVRDYNLNLIEDRNSGTIIAASGCVSEDTDVSFKWMKIDVCSLVNSQVVPNVRFKNTTSCSNDHVCGNDQQIQYLEEVSFSPRENGKYHLKVIVAYENKRKASDAIAVKNMTLKGEKRACDFQENPLNEYTSIICIVAASGFGIILLITLIIKRSKFLRYIYWIIPGIMALPSTNQRDNADDKGDYLTLSTAEAATKEIKEEEESQKKLCMFSDFDT